MSYAIVSDIDGVLILGSKVNLANETVLEIEEKKTPFYLMTNNGKITEQKFADNLNARFGS